jgi:hypothetical protein
VVGDAMADFKKGHGAIKILGSRAEVRISQFVPDYNLCFPFWLLLQLSFFIIPDECYDGGSKTTLRSRPGYLLAQ